MIKFKGLHYALIFLDYFIIQNTKGVKPTGNRLYRNSYRF
jgi:hypothetical protein